MTVDFTKMSEKIHKAFDSDYIDIYRQVEGSPERDLLYENVSCHIAIKSSDNPDPESVDVQPIIKSLAIHMANWVDIQNGDYVIAKKTDTKGNVLHCYSGTVGYPSVSMARKSVNMVMSTLKQIEPVTPAPTPEGEAGTVTISYIDNETSKDIKAKTTQGYNVGSSVIIQPIGIENYDVSRAELDGQVQQSTTVEIEEIEKRNYQLDYYYNKTQNLIYIRPLVDGVYTKDSGNLADGLHFYKKMPIVSVVSNNSIILQNIVFNHEEEGKQELKKNSIFIDNKGNCHKISTDPQDTIDGWLITYTNIGPINAEITHWYD